MTGWRLWGTVAVAFGVGCGGASPGDIVSADPPVADAAPGDAAPADVADAGMVVDAVVADHAPGATPEGGSGSSGGGGSDGGPSGPACTTCAVQSCADKVAACNADTQCVSIVENSVSLAAAEQAAQAAGDTAAENLVTCLESSCAPDCAD